jgi:hypothetical protein
VYLSFAREDNVTGDGDAGGGGGGAKSSMSDGGRAQSSYDEYLRWGATYLGWM